MEAFTSSVAHDLRAPLRGINGYCGLLLEDYGRQMPAEAQDYLRFVSDTAGRLSAMVNDLLKLAKVDRTRLTREPTSLNQVVEAARQELGPELSGRNIEWRIAALPTVSGDRGLLIQAFINLLGNAVKYSRPRQHAVIEVGEKETDNGSAIFVRDNGVGFNMKYAGRLFGVFHRLHSEQDFEGTGVGLATVQRIVQKHGGRIWAEAQEQIGAAFYFTLGGEAQAVPGTGGAEVRERGAMARES